MQSRKSLSQKNSLKRKTLETEVQIKNQGYYLIRDASLRSVLKMGYFAIAILENRETM